MRPELILPALLCSLVAGAADGPLKVANTIEIPNSKGGFDFLEVDRIHQRLLLDHTGNATLDIIDLKSEKLLKQIHTGAAQGVAIDSKGNRYFVSVSREKKLVIIDAAKLEAIGEVPLEGPGDATTFDSKHNRVYVGHDDAKELWVIDPEGKKVEATIPIGAGPEYVIYDPKTDRLFQNIKSDNTLLVIDAVKKTVIATWPTMPAKSPHGLAFDAKSQRLFVAGTNGKLAVLSAADGKLLGECDMVTGVDQIALDETEGRIYCPSSSGSMTVVKVTAEGATRIGDVATSRGAKTVAVDPSMHAVWIAYAEGSKTYARKFVTAE